MRVVVVGAGVAGLASALFFSRAGHDVTLLERDATPLPETPDEAFEWKRRGAPQVKHSHAFLARGRNLLRDRLPDVREALFRAGATEVGFADMAQTPGVTPQPGDEDLVMLCCRRTTFEWTLRRVALETIELRDGVVVEGYGSTNGKGPVRINSVKTDSGDLHADLVIDATGRPSHLPSMLADHGVKLPEQKRPVGIVYLSRFYRLRDPEGEQPPAFLGGDLEYIKLGMMRGDNHTFSVTIAYSTEDPPMKTLRQRFDRACATMPIVQRWLDVSEPISKVMYMGGLINRFRPLVHEGEPLVRGILAVGDSSVCTNPLYGRGCSLGLVHASLAVDAEDEVAFDEATRRELIPWFEASAAQDKVGIQLARGEQLSDFDAYMRDLAMNGIFPATRVDANVLRAWVRGFNLLIPPFSVLADPDVMARVQEVYNQRDEREPEPSIGLPRDEFMRTVMED